MKGCARVFSTSPGATRDRCLVIDAAQQSQDAVAAAIWTAVTQRFGL